MDRMKMKMAMLKTRCISHRAVSRKATSTTRCRPKLVDHRERDIAICLKGAIAAIGLRKHTS